MHDVENDRSTWNRLQDEMRRQESSFFVYDA